MIFIIGLPSHDIYLPIFKNMNIFDRKYLNGPLRFISKYCPYFLRAKNCLNL